MALTVSSRTRNPQTTAHLPLSHRQAELRRCEVRRLSLDLAPQLLNHLALIATPDTSDRTSFFRWRPRESVFCRCGRCGDREYCFGVALPVRLGLEQRGVLRGGIFHLARAFSLGDRLVT